jgi:hypothetical protein
MVLEMYDIEVAYRESERLYICSFRYGPVQRYMECSSWPTGNQHERLITPPMAFLLREAAAMTSRQRDTGPNGGWDVPPFNGCAAISHWIATGNPGIAGKTG